MPSYLHKTLRELPRIGTFDNIAVATHNMPLIETLNLMVDRRVSALPIVDKKNKVVEEASLNLTTVFSVASRSRPTL
jgi:CBS domain-containing protein